MTDKADLKVDENLDRILKSFDDMASPKLIDRSLSDSAKIILFFIRKFAPRDSGKYRDSWRIGQKTGNSIMVETPMGELFKILEFQGSDPHPITGNPLLAFEVDGVKVIVHSVNHPGFPPKPHVRKAVREFQRHFPDVIMKNLGVTSPLLFRDRGRQAATKIKEFIA